jgi:thiol-disulfide isomerase/thioredoxin
MKNLIITIFTISLILFSCSEKEIDTTDGTIQLSANKTSIVSDNKDQLIFKVTDAEGTDITKDSKIFINDEMLETNIFKTNQKGKFSAKAIYNKQNSNVLTITANESSLLKVTSINLVASKTSITADSIDQIVFTIKDNLGNDVSAQAKLFIKNKALTSTIFKTKETGEFTIHAKFDDFTSNSIKFNAVTPVGNYDYTRKFVVEDFTATWCGWCPQYFTMIENYHDSVNVIPIAIHDDNEMRYKHVNDMKSVLKVTGFPTVFLNRKTKINPYWTYKAEVANVAIGLKTSTSKSFAIINLKIGFRTKFDESLKLVVCLLENNLKHYQKNFLSGDKRFESNKYYSLPAVIYDFNHNHVLRKSATDIFGDAIPNENSSNKQEYIKQYEIALDSYNSSNCDIVAFVINESGEVINAQKVKLGEKINFE